MTEKTSAYNEFVNSVTEIRELRIHAESLVQSQNGSLIDQRICSGALLLLCGHLEVYFEKLADTLIEKIQENGVELAELPDVLIYYMLKHKIDPIIFQYNRNEDDKKSKKISKYKKLINKYIELYSTFNEIEYGNVIDKNIINKKQFNWENIIEDFSVPTFPQIKSYFERFGYYEFEKEFRSIYGEDFEYKKNNYNSIIARRNSIAHGETSELITTSTLKKIEDDLLEFCSSIDELFAGWCERKLHCSIRE